MVALLPMIRGMRYGTTVLVVFGLITLVATAPSGSLDLDDLWHVRAGSALEGLRAD